MDMVLLFLIVPAVIVGAALVLSDVDQQHGEMLLRELQRAREARERQQAELRQICRARRPGGATGEPGPRSDD